MPTQDDTERQQQILDAHRATLAHYLIQRARLGVDYAPPGVSNGIAEARAEIRRIKGILIGWGAKVEEHPDDEERSTAQSIDQVSPLNIKLQSTTRVTLLLEGDVQQFTSEQQAGFVFVLARVVNVSPEMIRIVHIGPGSVKLTLDMPADAAQRLAALYAAADPSLEPLHLLNVAFSMLHDPVPDFVGRAQEIDQLVQVLRSGDHAQLPELLAALRSLPPESARSALQQQGLQITGDGNIVGSGNVAIVLKEDVPGLAMQLTEVARSVRTAELYGQAAALLERNQVRDASASLAELRALDPHYRGSAELRDRVRRMQVHRRFRIGMWATIGLIAAMTIGFGSWSLVRPRTCPGEAGISGQGIRAIASQGEGDHLRWWLGFAGEGLADSSGSVYHAPDLGAETVLALMTDEKARRLWVGTWGGGLAVLRLNDGKESWRRYTVSDGLPGCQISAIHRSGERIYVGAYDGAGLGISDDSEHWRTFPPPNDWPANIVFWVTSLASAADNTLWVGTLRGVYRFDGNGWSRRYQPAWFGAKVVKVTAVGTDRTGVLWVGTEDQGLALLDTRQGQQLWIGPLTAQQGLASDRVTAIAFLPGGAGTLIGTANGLSICTLKGGQTSPKCAVISDARITKVMCLSLMPGEGDVWVGTAAREPIRLPAAIWQAALP